MSFSSRFQQQVQQDLEATLNAPSKFSENRWITFHRCTVMFRDGEPDRVQPTPSDWKALKNIGKDEEEPILFRSQALLTLGVLKEDGGEKQKAAEYYRRVIELVPKATASERNRKVARGTKVGFVLDNTIIPKAKDKLEDLERSGVGGGECDHCGKTRAQLGEALLRCSRCKNAFYCCDACQKQAWKGGGHKRACRKPGEIKPGDMMRITGVMSRPEYNSMVGKVVREVSNGRYEVSIEGLPTTISVAPDKLEHIRPAR
jgi:hypothetical protein